MDKVVRRIGRGTATRTAETALAGNDFPTFRSVVSYRTTIGTQLRDRGLPADRADYLVHLYGSQTPEILARADDRIPDPELRLALAELDFALDKEQVQRLDDFTIRRTGRLYFDRERLDGLLDGLMAYFAEAKGLSAETAERQLRRLREVSREHYVFGAEPVPA